MNIFKIYRIKFKNWDEYENVVNNLSRDGWEIDETLIQYDFEPISSSEHIVRLKKPI